VAKTGAGRQRRANAGDTPSGGRRGPSFIPLRSKLHRPTTRPHLVTRRRLIDQLLGSLDPLVLVVAPLGYGKTTTIAQWDALDERPFVWVTLDDSDNDPSQLLTYIVVALEEVIRLHREIFPRPPEWGPSFTAFALPRLTRTIAERRSPFVLVLDDVHVLRDETALDVIGILVQNLPTGSQIVLAGRDVPRLPIGRLLVGRSMLSLGSHQLAMSEYEGAQLLHRAGLPVGGNEATMLVRRTEGWPAGLYLAALALRDQPNLDQALNAFAGTETVVSDYLHDELLDALPADRLRFLLGTAALDVLSGELCDAVLGRGGSAAMLEKLSKANLFITPIDRDGVWFRRHQLFEEMLLDELRRRNPAAERTQHRRAAGWFADRGDIEAAVQHALASDDLTFAAELIARISVPYVTTGRASSVRRWIEKLPVGAVRHLPWFGATAAQAYVSSGDIERATFWLTVAERASDDETGPLPDGRASLRSAVAIVRASLGLAGIEQMERDASLGYASEPDGSPWKAFCAFLLGVVLDLRGDRTAAIDKLEEAAASTASVVPTVHAWSRAQLAICAMEDEDWEVARDHAERARMEVERSGLQGYTSAALAYAASALACANSRQRAEARRDAMRANRLLAQFNGLTPWMAAEARILVARTFVRLGEPQQARELLRQAQRDLSRVGEAPALRRRYEEALRAVSAERQASSAGPALTAAETRVVQFLPTHLSFREIAERLHVSRNTVKTQVISAYRKLGAANRTEAVVAARALALLEDDAALEA
jgi:LuxR family maltose regulon positive regulatory protein